MQSSSSDRDRDRDRLLQDNFAVQDDLVEMEEAVLRGSDSDIRDGGTAAPVPSSGLCSALCQVVGLLLLHHATRPCLTIARAILSGRCGPTIAAAGGRVVDSVGRTLRSASDRVAAVSGEIVGGCECLHLYIDARARGARSKTNMK